MNTICNWLGERIDHSLHDVQLTALTNIMPKIYADMSLQGVPEDKLNLKSYQTIMSRLKMEEASAMAGAALFEQPASGTSIFTSSILSSLASSSTTSSSNNNNNNANTGQSSPPSANIIAATTSNSGLASSTSPLQSNTHYHHQLASATGQLRLMDSSSSQPMGSSSSQPHSSGLSGFRARIQPASTTSDTYHQHHASTNQQPDDDNGDNIADRALQSATRMFKGFWAN